VLHIPRLVIIAGTGRMVGKTTVACRIIEAFRNSNITAVKISSHFHDPQDHLILLERQEDYILWEEKRRESDKDSSRFLQAGANRSFYIQAAKNSSVSAFQRLLELLPYSSPIVCESPSLARGIIPGALIIVTGEKDIVSGSLKDLSYLDDRQAFRITTSEVDSGLSIPLVLNESGFRVQGAGT
jgi:hypothetical protein